MKTVLTFVLLFVVAMHQSSAVAGGFREGTLYPGSDFDLETGHSTQKGQNPAAKHDLTWGCGPNEVEFLRALTGVTWAVPAKKSFDVGLSTMKQASFYAPIDGTGYPNLFRVPANAMQQLVGTVYYVATAEGNLARLRIVGCDPPVKKPMICRNVKIEYEVFIADGAWGSCTWAEVGSQKSHQAGSAWCPPGSLITQFDLDGDSTVSGTDAPIVGRARCCTHTKLLTGSCSWQPVGPHKSHQGTPDWCPNGSYISQFDLDGGQSPQDHPIVGQVRCCKAANNWGSCYWVEVGGLVSHQTRWTWCPNGAFLTQFDLDSVGNARAHDATS